MRRAERFVLLAGIVAASAAPLRAQDSVSTHAPHMAWGPTSLLLADILALRGPRSSGSLQLDLLGWSGSATDRIWFKADLALESDRTLELQLLRGWAVTPYWDLQLGAWLVPNPEHLPESSGGLAVGIQGLAPGMFDYETALLLGVRGEIGVRVTASHDLYLAQRLILQPRLEMSLEDRLDGGPGAQRLEGDLSFRLRYEIRREFAPYLGVAWARRDLEFGGIDGRRSILLGLRLWR